LHIGSCARRHFYLLFKVFFSLQLRPTRICTGRDTVRVRICTERDTVRGPSRDRDVAALQTSHGFAVVYHFRPASPIMDPSAPNIDRNGNASRFTVGNICFSVAFFLVVFFFVLCLCRFLVSVFIAVQRRLFHSESNLSRRRVLVLYRRVP